MSVAVVDVMVSWVVELVAIVEIPMLVGAEMSLVPVTVSITGLDVEINPVESVAVKVTVSEPAHQDG